MRYEIIDTEMETCSSVLDIGCNLGILTSMIGESGRFAVGVEKIQKRLKMPIIIITITTCLTSLL